MRAADRAQVQMHGVSKTFGAVRALAGVSATFSSGRVSVVTGPNGSGKSTLLALVGALLKPTSGVVDHGNLGSHGAAVRASLGWLGHESLCYPELSGRENVELAARLHGADPDASFEEARSRFNLDGFCERPVRTYSRGQRQRVALARALVHRPSLLLLDEPTAGLDVAGVERVATVMREEAARGAIVVVVTHDDRVEGGLSDDRVELERGRRIR